MSEREKGLPPSLSEMRISADKRERYKKSSQGKMDYINRYLKNNFGPNGFYTKLSKEIIGE